MRSALAIVTASLTLGLASQPMLAQGAPTFPLESIRMTDVLTGWAVTHEQDANGLLRTTDGGTHWKSIAPHLFYFGATAVEVVTSLFAWVGPFRTVDGGRTWKNVPAPGWVRSIGFIATRDGWLLSCQGANPRSAEVGVYRSTDGGNTWTRMASDRAGASENSFLQFVWGGEPHVTFLNATTGWITRSDPVGLDWSYFYLYATQDGGRTWRQQTLSLPPQLTSSWESGIMPPKFFTARDGILPVFYASLNPQSHRPIASFAVLYVTHDGGTTWAYTAPVPITNRAAHVSYYGRALWGMSFVDLNHGWMADENVLYATSDGGRRWAPIQTTFFSDVRQIDFISPQVGWAISQASPFLRKTVDAGRTWTPVPYTISQQ